LVHGQQTATHSYGIGRVLVAIPAYNEDRYIGSLVHKLTGASYEVLVVDDGSTDQTARIAEAAGASVARHTSNRGKAAAVQTAFEQARLLDCDALVLIDGDGQHEPVEVGKIAAPILAGTADMVVGSRFLGVRSHIPRWRVAGQHALTLVTNLGSGVPLTDSQSGFRGFSRRAVQCMRLRGAGFSIESEMQFQARSMGLSVVELPIQVNYNVPIKRNPVGQGLNVVDGVLRLIAQHRPLLFFGLPGLLMLAAGVGLGVYVVRIYETTLTLAVGYALITVTLTVVGTLSVFVGIMLHSIRRLLDEMIARVLGQG
jgi:hypothetical protein